MSLTVVGSIAFDAVKTPFGERERMLGGAAVHFSLAASFFTEVRCLLGNDAEIRQLTGESNLARAGRAVMELGPCAVVAKQGEYGAALFTENGFFALPGFPLEDVRDPTGAGDSFAGGFFGYLDGHGGGLDEAHPRRAMGYRTVLAPLHGAGLGT